MEPQATSRTLKKLIALVTVLGIGLVVSLTINGVMVQKDNPYDDLNPPWLPPPKVEVNRILILASLIFMLGLLTICVLLIKCKRRPIRYG